MDVRHLHSQLDAQQSELGNELLEAQRRVNDAHTKIQSLQVVSWPFGPSPGTSALLCSLVLLVCVDKAHTQVPWAVLRGNCSQSVV